MRRLLILSLGMLAGACNDPAPTDTGGIATNELSLQVIVDTDEFGTTVSLGIYARGHDYARLALAAGETLTLRVEGSAPIAFEKNDGSSVTTYSAHFASFDGDFAIDLERGGQTLRTSVSLPPSFAIDLPKTGLRLDRPFTITWSPSVATSSVKAAIASDCVRAAARTLAHDSGSFTWSAADYFEGAEVPPCTATVRISRGGGSIRIAPELAGVQLFRAEQHRTEGVLVSRP